MGASLVIGQQGFTTAIASNLSSSSLSVPRPIAFDSSGNLWINDFGHDRLLEFEPPFHTGMSANLVIGQRNFSESVSGVARNKLNGPAGIAFDSSGNLWLVDGGNDRVLEYSPPFANGMNASLVIGQTNFQASAPSTGRSGLFSGVYSDLTFDHLGNLWVGDAGNNRILEFQPPFTNRMNATIEIGQPDFSPSVIESPFDTSGCTSPPYDGLAFDSSGNLWASFNCRLLEFQSPFFSGMQPIFELEQPDFTSFAWVGEPNGLTSPLKISFDASGNLWVPDFNTNRVLEFASAGSMSHTTTSWVPNYGQFEFIAIVATLLVVGSIVGISARNKRSINKVTD